jgi:prolyl-tRNA editing enzyme YbaK/EbsC (Cys-tRNA(Pro) deacylase)
VDEADILIDKHLSEYDIFYPAAGTDASAVPISFNKLVEVTGGRVCDLTEPKLQQEQKPQF